MRRTWLVLGVLLFSLRTSGGQTVLDTFTVAANGDTVRFWAKIPLGYTPARPPALLVWWHQYGADHRELSFSSLDEAAEARGWISASHAGHHPTHYNNHRAQMHCRVMLNWLMAHYPFSRDSIYMLGGSMGGAGGQIWHNNNCRSREYVIAAHAGASQILDCHYRQWQYLQANDTNRAMRLHFGGLPGDRDSVAGPRDSIGFEYHRNSALYAADTTLSMHFNSLHLPCWNTWGNDSTEYVRYGYIAGIWDSLRRADHADTTVCRPASRPGHGMGLIPADSICNWLSGFSSNRYPEWISINADENDSYYWTTVELLHNDTTFGRYGARYNFAERRLDITLVRNIQRITVDFLFPWEVWDSLTGLWQNFDREIPVAEVRLAPVPPVRSVLKDENEVPFTYADGTLSVELHGAGNFTVYFGLPVSPPQGRLPSSVRLVAAYPNPFNTQIMLEIESNTVLSTQVLLYDALGRQARAFPVTVRPGTQRVTLAADGLGSGTYFAGLSDNPLHVRKVVLLK